MEAAGDKEKVNTAAQRTKKMRLGDEQRLTIANNWAFAALAAAADDAFEQEAKAKDNLQCRQPVGFPGWLPVWRFCQAAEQTKVFRKSAEKTKEANRTRSR